MSLDKAIASGKERRKPYRKAKKYSMSCRNHGGCPWCESNRTYAYRRAELNAVEELKEWLSLPPSVKMD